MKYLGVDYGTKRIGIAVSDPEGRIAFPKKTIVNKGGVTALQELAAICKKERISQIVVGLAISLGGKETDQTKKVRIFAERLKKATGLSTAFENEMLTTRMASHEGVNKEHIDAAAAALILQSYIDKKENYAD